MRKKQKQYYIFLLLITVIIVVNIFLRCKSSKEIVQEKIHNRIGNILYFDSLLSNIYDSHILKLNNNRDYRIISYISKDDCTECSLQLNRWIDFLGFLNKNRRCHIKLLFIISPEAIYDAKLILNGYTYKFPVYIDKKNIFKKINELSGKNDFNTFLINKENKILLMGNPVHKEEMRDLYLKVLNVGNVKNVGKKKTRIFIGKKILNFKDIKIGTVIKDTIKLKNVGMYNLNITDVVSSCGCIRIKYSKGIVPPNGKTFIVVLYKAKESTEFFEMIRIYSNSFQNPINVKVHGRVI